mmetsp:Transcript_113259/g.199944  ORF Transcript_113259/g.199944 Transcript_113259/m.199944 type:complete len:84 (-) Transcript_113259:16-267(-)
MNDLEQLNKIAALMRQRRAENQEQLIKMMANPAFQEQMEVVAKHPESRGILAEILELGEAAGIAAALAERKREKHSRHVACSH